MRAKLRVSSFQLHGRMQPQNIASVYLLSNVRPSFCCLRYEVWICDLGISRDAGCWPHLLYLWTTQQSSLSSGFGDRSEEE